MGDNGYGSISSYATKLYEGLVCYWSWLGIFNSYVSVPFIRHNLPPLSTLEMVVPANAVGKVMGKGGANLANIRKVSSHFLIYLSFILWKRKIIHWPLLLVSTTASVSDSYYTLKLLVCIVALDICRAVVAESLPFWIDLMSIKLWSLCFLSVACFIVMYFSFAFAKIKIKI
jgi:hypothetical protein